MGAFFDARCRKCNARIGWHGKATDMPNCHKCGAEPDRVLLAADEAKMEEFERLLALRAKECSGSDLRKRRMAAGLTLSHVAARLDVKIVELSGWERGEGKPDEGQCNLLDLLYGGDA